MERVATIINKLNELSKDKSTPSVLDIDLMLDYTRVLYADLLEARKTAPEIVTKHKITPPISEEEPTDIYDNTEIQDNVVTPAESIDNTATIDIRTVIGINDKYLYISELFDDDKQAYDEAIKQLNSFKSKSDAVNWVDKNLSAKYEWDKESEAVQSFYNLLNSSFS